MANEFGGPSPTTSFLAGLASSTMGAFKEDHDRELAEDFQRKTIDHDLLMKALQTVQNDDNLTPSQRTAATQEILNRSLDIFKPKGHGGIKENLKNLFGSGERYQPQGVGDLLTRAGQRPKADVTGVVDGGAPQVIDHGNNPSVILPAPPSMAYRYPGAEATYREQDLQGKERIIDANTTRQLAVQEAKNHAQRELNTQKNAEWIQRNGIRDAAKATLKLRQLASAYGDPNNPDNLELARQQMQSEMTEKKALVDARIALSQTRIKGINAGIDAAKQRIEIAKKGLSLRQQQRWDADAQVKGAWKKVDQYKSEAQRLWGLSAVAHGKYAKSGYQDEGALTEAQDYERQAQEAESVLQGVINNIQVQQEAKQGGVSLPAPPSSRRSGATLEGAVGAFRARTHRDPTPEEVNNIKKHYGFQ